MAATRKYRPLGENLLFAYLCEVAAVGGIILAVVIAPGVLIGMMIAFLLFCIVLRFGT